MDNKVARALRVFETLTEEQKREFLRSLRGFEERGRLDERVQKDISLIMGPVSGSCPTCGR
ncbi:MAG TPA: hypothetical protein VGU24_15180 [Microvirga sp.]|jgi:hypothetical protein|nr:hypothetical protein [Microvirga sp.]